MRRVSVLVLLPFAFGACNDGTVPSAPDSSTEPVPSASGDIQAQVIPGQYIVVFRDDVADPPGLANRLVRQQGGSLRFTYQYAIKGFSAELPEKAVDALRRNPNVAYIEPNGRVWAVGSGSQTDLPGGLWGLDRIDQRDGLDGSYSYTHDGTGVTAYIIDTGILTTHEQFSGRATSGWDFVDDDNDASDCNGHGTHVAGTVGGTTYGVAKNVKLVAVRVLDCNGSGTWDGVIAGIDYVTDQHLNVIGGPSVANMSLSGGGNTAVDDAVRNSTNPPNQAAGVFHSVAAGNGNFVGRPQDACGVSPARVSEAATVGATESDDDEASFSNYGTCVDILAPGVGVLSAGGTKSGTSMAAPHVAGAAALYLDANPGERPDVVLTALTSKASIDKIKLHRSSSRNGTPNLLLYTGSLNDNPPSVTDVAVSSVSAPTSAVEGDLVSVDVAVENVGNQDVTSDIDVMLTDDGVPIGDPQRISGLAAGASTTLIYLWDTTGASTTVEHTLTASHDFTDDEATNNSLSTKVTVNDPTVGTTPEVLACDPPSGNPGDRLTVAVTGSGFQDGATADFGARVTVQSVTVGDDGQLDVQIKVHPRAASGSRDVTVTNPDGQSGTGTGCFAVP